MKRIIVVAAVAVFAGCRSASPPAPRSFATAQQAWDAATEQGSSFTGGRLLARVSLPVEGGTRVFRARIDADPAGDYSLTALSPIGTELFTIEAEGGEAQLLDHRRSVFWKGSRAELARQISQLFAIDAMVVVRRLFDLAPSAASCAPVADELSCRAGDVTYLVSKNGVRVIETPLGMARREGSLVVITPTGGMDAGVEVLESVLEQTDVRLSTPGRGWSCCLDLRTMQIDEGS